MKAKTLTASLLLAVTLTNPFLGIVSVTRAQEPRVPQEISTNTSITSDGLTGETLQVQHEEKVFATKTPESVGKVDLGETREALASIDGLLGQSDTISSNSDADSSLEVETNGTKVDVPKDSTKPVTIESEGEKLEITLPRTEQTGQGAEIAKGVVAYASESDFTNAVQANEDGSVRMTTIIDNPNAPTEYTYEVNLEAGGYIELTEDGGAIVYNKDSEPIRMVATPWAKDAEGKDVKTWFTTDGKSLTQHVEHNAPGVVYPMTADPTWQELAYCALPQNIWACSVASGSLRNEAENLANEVKSVYGWSAWKGGADAVRHCYWSGRMVQRLGSRHAYEIGTRHEANSYGADKNMDLHNNAVGRAIGGWTSSSGYLKSRCIQGMHTGWLVRLEF